MFEGGSSLLQKNETGTALREIAFCSFLTLRNGASRGPQEEKPKYFNQDINFRRSISNYHFCCCITTPNNVIEENTKVARNKTDIIHDFCTMHATQPTTASR